jgi:hypothetical protein
MDQVVARPGAASQEATVPPMPEVADVSHRFVQAGRLRTHVAEAGAGRPVLLLHGQFQHWYAWREVIPALAARYRVICPDLRGHGWTETPRSGYRTAELAADVLALLDALGPGEGGGSRARRRRPGRVPPGAVRPGPDRAAAGGRHAAPVLEDH